MVKVLVVDDEPPIKEWVENIIKSLGEDYSLIAGPASNGAEALKICEMEKPDIMFTDIIMPVMNGVELVKELRNKYEDIKIIVLSNYSDFEYVRETLLSGASDYLLKLEIKPSDMKKILDKVKKVTRYSQPVKSAIEYIKNNYNKRVNRTIVSEYVHLNESYFSELFKKETGYSFSDFLISIRIEAAKELLKSSDSSVLNISEKVGYFNQSYFTKLFKSITGMTPFEYRERHTR